MEKQIVNFMVLIFVCLKVVDSNNCPRTCVCTSSVWACSGNNLNDEVLKEIAQSADSSKVTSLDIDSNSLVTFPAKEFVNFTKLEKLDISSIAIRKIPESLSTYIPSLRVVTLQKNKLQSLERADFFGYQNIQTLSLTDNNISALEPGVFENLPNVTELTINDNKIKVLHKGVFSGLTKLSSLDLNQNGVEKVEAGLFDDNKNLKTIQLNNNMLKSLPIGFLPKHPTSVSIYINNNQLTNNGLPDGVFNLSSYFAVSLDGNKVSTIRKEWFSDTISVLQVNTILCDCYSYEAYQDILNRNKNFTIYGTCATPISLSGQDIEDVFSDNQVNCTSCSINGCMHNSTCTVLDKRNYTCNCTDRYFGEFCQNIDKCIPNPCLNNGTCKNVDVTNYTCTCLATYEGENCQARKRKIERENERRFTFTLSEIIGIVVGCIIGGFIGGIIVHSSIVYCYRRKFRKAHNESVPMDRMGIDNQNYISDKKQTL